jgi:SAM-dependent methyltransferase
VSDVPADLTPPAPLFHEEGGDGSPALPSPRRRRARGEVSEATRIAAYYQQREASGMAARYSLFQRGSLFRMQTFERDVLGALARHGRTRLGEYRMLDVGCGDGAFLRRLVSWGADPSKLSGVDLLPERVEASRRIDPSLDVRRADASALPYDAATFDLVFQHTVFSSILDDHLRQAVAAEMIRVLRPGGLVVSYDFRVARDRRNTRPLRAAELSALFPGFAADARRVTLIPPLARALAGRSWILCEWLQTIPLLRTHDLVVLTRPSGS